MADGSRELRPCKRQIGKIAHVQCLTQFQLGPRTSRLGLCQLDIRLCYRDLGIDLLLL